MNATKQFRYVRYQYYTITFKKTEENENFPIYFHETSMKAVISKRGKHITGKENYRSTSLMNIAAKKIIHQTLANQIKRDDAACPSEFYSRYVSLAQLWKIYQCNT